MFSRKSLRKGLEGFLSRHREQRHLRHSNCGERSVFESHFTKLNLQECFRPTIGPGPNENDLAEAFGPGPQIKAIQFFARQVNFADKAVLEVGGALPAPVVLDRLAVKNWVAVNFFGWDKGRALPANCWPLSSATAQLSRNERYLVFDGRAEEMSESFNSRFDLVCSINAFEHIHNIWKTLEKLYCALKPGGLLLATFSPVWPGKTGHHVWISPDQNFNTFSLLPDYIHLLYSKQKCRNIVMAAYGPDIADKFIQRAFFEPVINRLFVEDFVESLETGPFEYWKLDPWGVETNDALLERLHAMVGRRCFAQGLNLLAQRTF